MHVPTLKPIVGRMNKLAENLRKMMRERNLSQIELAERAGITQGTISGILRGTTRNPAKLPHIADALGVSVEELRGKTEAFEMLDGQQKRLSDILKQLPVSALEDVAEYAEAILKYRQLRKKYDLD